MGRRRKIGLGQITLQLEYYMSDQNLKLDEFMQTRCEFTPLPAWPLRTFCNFSNIKLLVRKSRFVKRVDVCRSREAKVKSQEFRSKNRGLASGSKTETEPLLVDKNSDHELYYCALVKLLKRAANRSPCLAVFKMKNEFYIGRGTLPEQIFLRVREMSQRFCFRNLDADNNLNREPEVRVDSHDVKCAARCQFKKKVEQAQHVRALRMVKRQVEHFVPVRHARFDAVQNSVFIYFASPKLLGRFFGMWEIVKSSLYSEDYEFTRILEVGDEREEGGEAGVGAAVT